jgi:four helix bundle protein
MKAETFQDLHVYSLALRFQQAVFVLSKRFPKEEAYSLTGQIRRSSRSIGANLAEAWQKRRYPAHFINKLTDSDGENAETQHWLQTSRQCGYLTDSEIDQLMDQSKEIGRLLGAMLKNAPQWCNPT